MYRRDETDTGNPFAMYLVSAPLASYIRPCPICMRVWIDSENTGHQYSTLVAVKDYGFGASEVVSRVQFGFFFNRYETVFRIIKGERR
jgi:hypothetical protein